MADFTFYNNADYFRQVAADVAQAKSGDRVALATMTFEPRDPLVGALMQELNAAATRGVQVLLCIDARTFLRNSQTGASGPLWYRPQLEQPMREPYSTYLASLKKLQACGGDFAVTNIPRHPLSQRAAGRSHIKGAVVNDKIYIGGCNLEDATAIDMMVCWQSREASDWFFETIRQMTTTGDTHAVFQNQDRTFDVDGMALLLDSGKPRQSIIYNQALQLIDEAQEWVYYTGQLFPNGKTGKHLLAAHKRGVAVHVAYAHPSIHGYSELLHRAVILREQTRLPKEFFVHQLPEGSPRLHAKVLASEKAAMVGSHNYVSQGVTFGTAEIALLNRNPAFSLGLKDFIQTEIEKSTV